MTEQGVPHWFVAKYCGGDVRLLSPMTDLLLTMIKQKTLIAFATDLSACGKLIMEEMSVEGYKQNMSTSVNVSKMVTTSSKTYKDFKGHMNHKRLLSRDMLPTFSTAKRIAIFTVVEGGKMVHTVEDKPVTFSEVVSTVIEDMTKKDYEVEAQTNKHVLLVSELGQISYEEAEHAKVEETSCEQKASVAMVLESMRGWHTLLENKDFASVIVSNMITSSSTIRMNLYFGKNKRIQDFAFSKILKYFLDPGHKLHPEDLPKAMLLKLGIVLDDSTSVQLRNEIFKRLEKLTEKAYLFADAWLDDIKDVESLRGYYPVYTGHVGTPFVLLKAEGDVNWVTQEIFRTCLNAVRKLAKLLGLWNRLGLDPKVFCRIAARCLRLEAEKDRPICVSVKGCFELWMSRMVLTEYLETSKVKKEDEGLMSFDMTGIVYSLEDLLVRDDDEQVESYGTKIVKISGGGGGGINSPKLQKDFGGTDGTSGEFVWGDFGSGED